VHQAVGVCATRADGRFCVVEYSEFKAHAGDVDSNGKLLFNAAHICVNTFSVEFVRRVLKGAVRSMPMHVAERPVDAINNGKKVRLQCMLRVARSHVVFVGECASCQTRGIHIRCVWRCVV
jgi:UDP-N-acetylglucosamine pyrophosphorylase